MNKSLFFLFGCLVSRLLLSLIAKNVDIQYLSYSGYITLIPSLGFFILYLFDLRKTGFEAQNNIVWWNKLRPLHGAMYLLYSIYAIKKEKFAWIVLFFDFLFGLGIWLYKNQIV